MNVDNKGGYVEYVLPCEINILSEDDLIIEFDINCVSMVCFYLFM